MSDFSWRKVLPFVKETKDDDEATALVKEDPKQGTEIIDHRRYIESFYIALRDYIRPSVQIVRFMEVQQYCFFIVVLVLR
jgi:hypothetical protein